MQISCIEHTIGTVPGNDRVTCDSGLYFRLSLVTQDLDLYLSLSVISVPQYMEKIRHQHCNQIVVHEQACTS